MSRLLCLKPTTLWDDSPASFVARRRLEALILTQILQTEVKSKMSARKQGFAKRVRLSRWFAIQQDHRGSVEDEPPPSRRCLPSWSEPIDQGARPTDPSLRIRPSTVCQLPLLNATPTFEALVIVLRHAPEDFSHLGAHRFHEKPTSSFVADLSERS